MATISPLIVLAGGGSGGHLYPGLAVAQALAQTQPQGRVLFLCTERQIDRDILDGTGWSYQSQPVKPLPSRPWQVWSFWQSWRASIRQAQQLFEKDRPAAVLGLGGFASGPAMKVAAGMGIPTGMLNPDAVPGKANRYLARFSDQIFVQWEESCRFFGKYSEKCVVLGCPIRSSITTANRSESFSQLELDLAKKTLAIMGGSQGGYNVNMAITECLASNSDLQALLTTSGSWQILHLTGKTDEQQVRQKYQQAGIAARVMAFTPRMDMVLATADLVIGRAGASTLAELTATGKPSILLPYPYHRDQHQWRNAEVLAHVGAARIVRDYCNPIKTALDLAETLRPLLSNEGQLREMALAAGNLGKVAAAQEIAQKLIQV